MPFHFCIFILLLLAIKLNSGNWRSMQKANFDSHAPAYDASFSDSHTGTMYRKLVHDYLRKSLPENKCSILEVNCGTGVDALFLAGLGHQVLATDVSPEMIRIANEKLTNASLPDPPVFKVYDLKDPKSLSGNFDVVFSNFGGLNCLSPDELIASILHFHHCLKPDGRLVMVVMPPFCAWESLYFFVRLRWKQIFRRASSNPVLVELDGVMIKTWYYQPSFFIKHLTGWKLEHLQPIGIALPTPSMDPMLRHRPRWSRFLLGLEKSLAKYSFLSSLSDHFLIDLKRT
jgi:SAM-dependent methyltransferase